MTQQDDSDSWSSSDGLTTRSADSELERYLGLLGRAMSRRDALRLFGIGGALLAGSGVLAACVGSPSSSTGTSSGDIDLLTFAFGSLPASLDIAKSYDTPTQYALAISALALFAYDNNIKLVPSIAESFTHPDPTTYVYKIRTDVKFWDGSPLTAEDVRFEFARQADPALASQISTFTNMTSVAVTGSNDVTVKLGHPDLSWNANLALTPILSKKFTQGAGANLGVAQNGKPNILGAGPYRITEYDPSSHLTFERLDSYWTTKPKAKTVRLNLVSDATAMKFAMQSGSIDGTFNLPTATIKDWEALPDAKVLYGPLTRTTFLGLDLETAPWSDIHVRRAIAHLVDRPGYVQAFQNGIGSPAQAVMAPFAWTDLVSSSETTSIFNSLTTYENSVAAAKQELQSSAYPNGFSATFNVPQSNQLLVNIGVALGQALKGIGVNLTVKEVSGDEWGAYIYAHKNIGLQIMQFGPNYADPADYIELLYSSANATKNGLNFANVKDPSIDALIAQEQNSVATSVRVQAFTNILKWSADNLPYIPLTYLKAAMALNSKYVYNGQYLGGFTGNQVWVSNISKA